jgi:hypothetical protein
LIKYIYLSVVTPDNKTYTTLFKATHANKTKQTKRHKYNLDIHIHIEMNMLKRALSLPDTPPARQPADTKLDDTGVIPSAKCSSLPSVLYESAKRIRTTAYKAKLLTYYNGEEVVPFYSGATWPNCILSNFYGCTVNIDGCAYSSLEHWYQSQKLEDGTAFRMGGLFSELDSLKLIYVDYEKKIRHYSKKNMVGIVPKVVITRLRSGTRAQRADLVLQLKANPITFASFDEAYAFWRPALKAMMDQNKEVGMLLQSHKGKYLLEFCRGAERQEIKGCPTLWGGMIKNDVLYGHNWMGLFWMRLLAETNSS